MRLRNLYDSHVHWQATGQVDCGWNLRTLTSRQQLEAFLPRPEFLREDWLTGFGWDENHFTDLRLHRETLDEFFPDRPVLLSRMDGHSSWANSEALRRLEAKSDDGILKEAEHIKALMKLPPFSLDQRATFLRKATEKFHRAGFTHIRDMGSDEHQFRLALDLNLKLHVRHNFSCEDVKDFERALEQAKTCRKLETESLKVSGIKIYLDGSLGSQTALLSQVYPSTSSYGETHWSNEHLRLLMKESWKQGFEFSVHTIGDQAAHLVVEAARQVYAEGISGILNLEHVQVLRQETIQAMKSLHVVCHLQPCHWLSDRTWLSSRLGPLYKYAFPWEALRAAKIPFYFGSDSPIEAPSYFSNMRALNQSGEHGIRPLQGDPNSFHLDKGSRIPETYTVVDGDQVKEVWFQKEKIL